MKWHPDKHASKTDAEKQNAEERFKQMAEAYDVLRWVLFLYVCCIRAISTNPLELLVLYLFIICVVLIILCSYSYN